jgi:hypothetical protein
MALTAEEKQELDRLEKELGGDSGYVSVLSPTYKEPTLGQQFKQATIETLPELGGMLGGALGAASTRSPTGGRVGGMLGQAAVRGTVGAGFGGAIGEAGKQAIEGTPDFLKVVTSGVEQATYDSLGNLVFNAGGKLYNVGKDRLMGLFGNSVPADPNIAATLAADRLLKESGGFGLTPFQSTGGTMSGISESIARGSFTGKPVMMAAEKATDTALQTAKTKILDNITTGVYDSVATGESFANAVKAGDDALKNTVRPFYETLSQTTGATVNLIPIQNQANQLLNKAEKAGGLTLTDSERAFLTKISSAPESIDFGTAHDILSSFKTIQRDAKSGTSPDTALYGRISSFVDGLQNQMDSSFKKIKATGLGSQLGGVQTVSPSPLSFDGRIAEDTSKTLSEQYKLYSNLYRQGIEDLYSETTSKLLAKDPEFVGKNIFASGNVTAFKDMTKALSRAKQLNKELDVQSTIDSVRRGYVENLLKSEGSLATLGQKIDSDETVRRTFKTVLTEDQQNNVKRLLKAAELSNAKPTADAPLFFAAQQAQAIGTLGGGALVLLNPDAQKVAADNPGWSAVAAGTMLFGPRFIAKSITDPRATNAALSLLKQQESGQAVTGPLFLKAIQAFEKVGITAEDLLSSESTTTSKAPIGLTPAEQEELRKLEQELGQR